MKYSVVSIQILATHGHLDHLWGAPWACEQWHTKVLIHEADIPLAKAMQEQYDMFGVRAEAKPFPREELVNEGMSELETVTDEFGRYAFDSLLYPYRDPEKMF